MVSCLAGGHLRMTHSAQCTDYSLPANAESSVLGEAGRTFLAASLTLVRATQQNLSSPVSRGTIAMFLHTSARVLRLVFAVAGLATAGCAAAEVVLFKDENFKGAS